MTDAGAGGEAVRAVLRHGADLALRTAPLQRTALRSAARRHRGIALLWHRIGPAPRWPSEVVPTVPTAAFIAQLDLIAELGDIVPLAELAQPGRAARPRFALTFDDDDAGHARHVLPLLAERALPATFFLSGRWLHGRGPYWWEVLEEDIAEHGRAAVAQRHGLPAGLSATRIAQALTGTPAAAVLAAQARAGAPPPMDGGEAAALVAGGMEIGFHTIDHDVLPLLDDIALGGALNAGRAALSAALATPIQRFAYPHGRVDGRVAGAVLEAGYRSAWTTAKRVSTARESIVQRGRWDISGLSAEEARARLLRGLARRSP